jgi:hypothetical protein
MYLGTRTKQHKMRALPTLRGIVVDGKSGRSNEKPHLTVLDVKGHRCQDFIQLILKTILLETCIATAKMTAKSKRAFRLRLRGSVRTTILMLLYTLRTMEPGNPRPRVNLNLRFQCSLVQIEIINSANPRDQHSREPGRDSVHQRSTDRAEVVLHGVAAFDGLVLRELGELVTATDVLGLGVFDDEVGGEHACCDFTAVGAVADERVYEAGSRSGLCGALVMFTLSNRSFMMFIRRATALHRSSMWLLLIYCLYHQKRLRKATECWWCSWWWFE